MARVTASIARLLDTDTGERIFRFMVGLLFHDRIRHAVIAVVGCLTGMFVRSGRRHGTAARIDRERELFALAVLDTVDRIAGQRAISPEFMQHASLLWTKALIGVAHDDALDRFKRENGVEPPWVLVVAPTGACNLGCPGCYSASAANPRMMPFAELDRLVTEAKEQWGIKVLVITGGEPFLYRSESKGILDLAERHQDLLCLIFTNGTLIDREAARRLASIGTPTTALSVEGLKGSTDARRGPGSFEKITRAMDILREEGALFGISMTATRDNCEELLSDEHLSFFFGQKSAFYGFIFQYMPEGRDPDPTLMPTPEQRLWMWKRSWEVVEERRIPLFDFWNHGTMIGGCVAAGRERGYVYVDWDSNVLPCVFAPYSDCNIQEIHAAGGTLNDAWSSPFLTEIRSWQRRHAACDGSITCAELGGRMVCACPVRDHYADFREMVVRSGASPVGSSAEWCLANPGFASQMADYGRDFAELSRPVIEAEYERRSRG